MTADEAREALRAHVTALVTRHKGRIWQWDIANEVIEEDGSLRKTAWLEKLGPGYIADAFR